VNAGISVVSLRPTEMLFERGCDLTRLILAVIEFGRVHSESATKANRMGEVWAEKRRATREIGALMTRMLPAWIEERNGKLVLIPDRAKIVRRMFDLCIKGYGSFLIVRELTNDNVAVWGQSKNGWSRTYVHKILSGRAVLGECQPARQGKPDGDPIPDYYPAVVDESTWLQAQAALARRKGNPGPIGEKVATLFGGLLHDAITGDHLRITWQMSGTKGDYARRRSLVTVRSMEGKIPSRNFPAEIFENAVLSLLKEVNPADVLGKEPESESTAVAAELAIKEQRSRQIEAELAGDGDDVPALVRVLRKLDDDCSDLRKRLVALRQKESNPREVAWAETLTLLDVAQDEANRLRLRELLRTIVEEIWILIVPRRSHRLAAVQVYFRGDGRRDYLIHYQAKAYRRKGGWSARSLPSAIAPEDLDLRRKQDVEELTKMLSALDIDLLADAMRQERG
jgi:hypothetical protein